MSEFEIVPSLLKILSKLAKKDKESYEAVLNRIEEIASCDVEHYKNSRYGMKTSKRVHLGHFVLILNYDKKNDTLKFLDYDHHDNIYKR